MLIDKFRSEFPPTTDFLDNEFYTSLSQEILSSVQNKISPDLYSNNLSTLFSEQQLTDHLKHLMDLLSNPAMYVLQPVLSKYSSISSIDVQSSVDDDEQASEKKDELLNAASSYQSLQAAMVDVSQSNSLSPGSDLLLFVSLWQSAISCPHETCADLFQKKEAFICPKIAQEVILPSKNSLADFKNQLYCYGNLIYEDAAKNLVEPRDNMLPLSLPKDPNDASGIKFRELPSFFFIEDTFFIDYVRGTSSCSDPVSCIIPWLDTRQNMPNSKFYIPPGTSPRHLVVKDMSSVKLEDVSLQLDKLYLFSHNGNCEHVFTFNELRLVHPYHLSETRSYPHSIFYQKTKRRKCRICEIYFAKYITFNDLLAPELPCFWCERCYADFHIDPATKLEYYTDFKAYRYIQE